MTNEPVTEMIPQHANELADGENQLAHVAEDLNTAGDAEFSGGLEDLTSPSGTQSVLESYGWGTETATEEMVYSAEEHAALVRFKAANEWFDDLTEAEQFQHLWDYPLIVPSPTLRTYIETDMASFWVVRGPVRFTPAAAVASWPIIGAQGIGRDRQALQEEYNQLSEESKPQATNYHRWRASHDRRRSNELRDEDIIRSQTLDKIEKLQSDGEEAMRTLEKDRQARMAENNNMDDMQEIAKMEKDEHGKGAEEEDAKFEDAIRYQRRRPRLTVSPTGLRAYELPQRDS